MALGHVGGTLTAGVAALVRHPDHAQQLDCAGRVLAEQLEEKMGPEESFDAFKQCAVEVLQVEPGRIVPEARFAEDLDADSLDLVELVMALEERFGIDVPESELEGIQTVGQAYDLVTSKI